MALLNIQPVLRLPAAMWLVFRAVADLGPLAEDALFALVSPRAIRPPGDRPGDPPPGNAPRGALIELIRLGLLAADGDGPLSVPAGTSRPMSYVAFCAVLRDALLSGEVTEPPLDEAGANDLLRGLAWLLTTDPLAAPWSKDAAANQRVPAENTLVFVNDTRWNGFRYWAHALGCAEPGSVAGSDAAALAPNPTRALRDFVAATYPPGTDVAAARRVDEFRAAVPVVPGGAISRALGYDRDPREVDRATTYALESGRAAGWLTLERRADAASTVQLAALDQPGAGRVVSDVVVGEAARV